MKKAKRILQPGQNDPLRQTWRKYCLLVTIEGFLLVLGIMGFVLTVDTVYKILHGDGLGVLYFIGTLVIIYFTAVGIFKPFVRYLTAFRTPPSTALPRILEIIIPSFRGQNLSPGQMRDIIRSKPGLTLFNKKRLVRNAVISILGVVPYLYLML